VSSFCVGWATWYQVAASAAVFSIKLCTVLKVVPVQAYYLEMVEIQVYWSVLFEGGGALSDTTRALHICQILH